MLDVATKVDWYSNSVEKFKVVTLKPGQREYVGEIEQAKGADDKLFWDYRLYFLYQKHNDAPVGDTKTASVIVNAAPSNPNLKHQAALASMPQATPMRVTPLFFAGL